MNRLNDIDIKIIKFLLTGSAYSELAIVKNLGITYEELELSYKRLENFGYLQSYLEFERENPTTNSCNKRCGSCNKGCSSNSKNCGSCKKNIEDFSNVKVITWKAISEFS